MNMLSTRPSRTRRAAERHGGRAPCSFVGLRLIVMVETPKADASTPLGVNLRHWPSASKRVTGQLS